MKVFSTIILTLFLFCTQNTAFAIVAHSNDPVQMTNQTANMPVTKQKKPNFAERFVAKKMAKMFVDDKSTLSQGDKLATFGFWGVVGSVALSTIGSLAAGSSGLPAAFGTIITLISLAGLILCIVALTRDDLSAKGKKMAKWGVGIFLALLLIALILIVAVLAAFG